MWRAARSLAPTIAVAIAAVGCLEGPRHRHAVMFVSTPAPTPARPQENFAASNVETAPTKDLELAKATASPTPIPAPTVVTASTTIVTSDGPLDLPNGSFPAVEYGAMSDAQCEAELKKRAIAFTKVASASGVADPIRLAGNLHGVDVHGLEKNTSTSVYEILDCRLALALDDFASILEKHDVVEAIHFSIYRPEKGAKKKSKHAAALAIDLGTMVKKDGSKLSVENDWHGFIGAKSCGPNATPSTVATKEAAELREILCKAYDLRLFNVLLTPNYNKPHYNHFHLEVTRGVKWVLLR